MMARKNNRDGNGTLGNITALVTPSHAYAAVTVHSMLAELVLTIVLVGWVVSLSG